MYPAGVTTCQKQKTEGRETQTTEREGQKGNRRGSSQDGGKKRGKEINTEREVKRHKKERKKIRMAHTHAHTQTPTHARSRTHRPSSLAYDKYLYICRKQTRARAKVTAYQGSRASLIVRFLASTRPDALEDSTNANQNAQRISDYDDDTRSYNHFS